MRRGIYLQSIVDRIMANPELGMCGLRRESVELLIKACQLFKLSDEWIAGHKPLPPDRVEVLAFLLGELLDAVQAETEEPTQRLRLLSGGGG